MFLEVFSTGPDSIILDCGSQMSIATTLWAQHKNNRCQHANEAGLLCPNKMNTVFQVMDIFVPCASNCGFFSFVIVPNWT